MFSLTLSSVCGLWCVDHLRMKVPCQCSINLLVACIKSEEHINVWRYNDIDLIPYGGKKPILKGHYE